MVYVILSWSSYDDIVIVSNALGIPRVYSTQAAAKYAAKRMCAFNYKIVKF